MIFTSRVFGGFKINAHIHFTSQRFNNELDGKDDAGMLLRDILNFREYNYFDTFYLYYAMYSRHWCHMLGVVNLTCESVLPHLE